MTRLGIFGCLGALSLFFFNVGCGKYDRIDDGEFTEVTFQHTPSHKESKDDGPSIKSGVYTGGVMIYAYSSSYVTNIKLNDENAPASIRLPNGAYTFYSFAYDSLGFSGVSTSMKCGITGLSAPIVLSGTATTVPIELTTAQCANGAFVGNDSQFQEAANFAKLEVVHCGTAAGTTIPGFPASSDCSATPWTTALSFKARALIYVYSGGALSVLGSGLEGSCMSANSTGFSTAANSRFPVGASDKPGLFAFEIDTYSDTACTSAAISTNRFHKGLVFGTYPDAAYLGKAIANTAISNKTRLFLRSP